MDIEQEIRCVDCGAIRGAQQNDPHDLAKAHGQYERWEYTGVVWLDGERMTIDEAKELAAVERMG